MHSSKNWPYGLRFDQDQVSIAPAKLSKLRTRTSISGRRFPGPYRFSNRPVYPRADETGYRLIGVVVAFRRIIGDPTLSAKPGIRTAVEKSAHNKRPSRGRCPRAPSVRPRRPLTLLHGHRPCGQRSGAHRNVVRTARPQGPSFGGARRPDRRYRGVREPTEIFALRL